MTNLEAVSKIKNLLKLNNKDSRIPNRLILSELRTTARQLISQRLGERSLNNELNLYSIFDCIEFEKIDVISCPVIEFRRCGILMKSKKALPELLFSRLGSSLKNITTVDNEKQFNIVDINQYRRNKSRKYKNEDEVDIYLGVDNHLYIPDEEIYALSAEGITLNTDEIDDCSGKNQCKSGWDYEFICPNKIEDYVFKQTLQTIASTYGTIIQDSNPNGINKQETN